MDSAASKANYDTTRSVFVGNLPFTVDVRTQIPVLFWFGSASMPPCSLSNVPALG